MKPDHQQTIDDFGAQWSEFDDLDHGYYGTEILDDILDPVLPADALHGKRVADIGSGTGRIVRMLLRRGAGHVTAIEPAKGAFDVLVRNTRDVADRVRYLNVEGAEIPPDDFDCVVSIGVIHHIPDPAPTLAAAFRALRPGGTCVIWVYGREGNGLYLVLAEPVRRLTRRMPDALLRAVSWMLFPPLRCYIALCRVLPLPMRKYMRDVLAHLTPRQLVLNVFDQLNPAYAKYYTRGEAEALLRDARFHDVTLDHRHGYSWTVRGTKPGPPAAGSTELAERRT